MVDRRKIIQILRSFVELNRNRYKIIRISVFGSAAIDRDLIVAAHYIETKLYKNDLEFYLKEQLII
jgi:predicted nucleotidyltransferase